MKSQIPFCRKYTLHMFIILEKFLIGHFKLVTFFLILLNIFIITINFCKAESIKDKYDFKGRVVVTDGDTLKAKKIKIRLHGIDAPESKQKCKSKNKKPYPCGYRSTLFLKSLIVDNTVYCKGEQKDRYRRLIAVCYSGKVNLNSKMVEEGWAIAYRYYSNDYIFEEEIAKKNKKGIWQGNFIEPYAWRKKQLSLKN